MRVSNPASTVLLPHSSTVPDTPAGQRLLAFVKSLSSGNLSRNRAFIDANYATSALKGQTPDQRALWDAYLFSNTHGLMLIAIEEDEPFQVLAHAQAVLTGEWYRIKLEVSSEGPHPITALTVRPGSRPRLFGRHSELSPAGVAAPLQQLLDQLVAADMFSGVALIAQEDEPIFKHVSGFASQTYQAPNQFDTKFNVGSLAKMFTALAIMQLAEQGKLDFAAPISRYLPDYPPEVADRVTIHHLLTHTSGLGNFWNEKFEASRARIRSVGDFIPLFINDPLSFEPGTKFLYANAGYILLGAIIEQVSGQDYYDYICEHIYRPAGMTHTDFYEMDRPPTNIAVGYTTNGLHDFYEPSPRRNNLFMHVVKGGPAGGAFSTAEDLLSFSAALRGHRLLGPEYSSLMMAGKVSMEGSEEKQYGYGLMVTLVDGKRIVGHSGTFPGIGARLDMYLDHGTTVVILSNYDPHITQAIGNKLREWLAGY